MPTERKEERKDDMKEKLEQLKAEALRQIEASDALEKLNEVRVGFLGKKGELTSVLKRRESRLRKYWKRPLQKWKKRQGKRR